MPNCVIKLLLILLAKTLSDLELLRKSPLTVPIQDRATATGIIGATGPNAFCANN